MSLTTHRDSVPNDKCKTIMTGNKPASNGECTRDKVPQLDEGMMMMITPGSHNGDNDNNNNSHNRDNNDNESSSPLPHLKHKMEGAIIFPFCINQPSPAPTPAS